MPRSYVDPGEELGRGIESAGGSIAQVLFAHRQAGAVKSDAEQDTKLFDALVQPDASGRMVGETLSEAPNKPLAALKWMRDMGISPKPERFAQIMTMISSPAGEGKHVKTMPGDEYAREAGLPEPDRFRGYVVKHNTKTGDADWLYQPKEQKAGEAPVMRSVDVGDQSVTYQWDQDSKQWGEVARAPRWQPEKPGDGLGMSQAMPMKTKGRDPVTGEMVERTSTFEFVPRKGGGGFVRSGPPLMEEESREPLSKPEAGAVAGAREGVRLVGELRGLLFQGGKLNTGALAGKALGLPGVVAPEGASIEPKVLQAVDPYVRLTTGAALNEQELENAQTMFVPSITDGEKLVKDKLDRLERFLSGDLALMGMVASPGSPLSEWVAGQGGGSGKAGAVSGKAPAAAAAVPKITGKADYDKLPSGAPFEWNGKRGVKP